MKNKTIISIRNLTYIFNRKTAQENIAINNLSFDFEKHKIHYIIGNSGSGKSTLVHHFNALIKSNKGDIIINGHQILGSKNKIKNIKRLRRDVSLVFQYPEYQLFKDTIKNEIMFGPKSFGIHKTLFKKRNLNNIKKFINDNFEKIKMEFGLKINSENLIKILNLNNVKFRDKYAILNLDNNILKKKMKLMCPRISMDQVITETATKYLEKMGMSKSFLESSPFGLSGGQKRRVAIAGILAIEPKILIFDEPTAGLDPQGVKEMLEIIKSEKRSGRTLFVITHSMDEVLECGDNVVVMDEGKIIASGTPYEVFMNKELYKKTKIAKPKVIDFIDKLNSKNSNFKELYKIKPKNSEELASAILKLI